MPINIVMYGMVLAAWNDSNIHPLHYDYHRLSL